MDTTTAYVTGKVSDLDYNLGLKGAHVAFKNEQYSFNTICKGDGIFTFGHIPSGTYILTSTFIGFYSLKDTVTVKPGDVVKLKIKLGTDY
ncbi:beta-sandwich domain-containing protein [Nibribacter koreensis]